jgi:hypothetical protein
MKGWRNNLNIHFCHFNHHQMKFQKLIPWHWCTRPFVSLQVGAIRVSSEDQQEALMEKEDAAAAAAVSCLTRLDEEV